MKKYLIENNYLMNKPLKLITFGKRVKELLVSKGLSQIELANSDMYLTDNPKIEGKE